MSNKGGRKSHTSAVAEEKEKRTDSPVKEMKKKIAANAEKEKQTDKTEKTVTLPEKSDKNSEKVTEKSQNEKMDKKANNEKVDNKKAQSNEKDKSAPTPEKNAHKPDKNAEKTDKSSEKDKPAEKTKSSEKDKPAEKTKSSEKDKPAEKTDKKTEKVADMGDKKADKPAEKKNEPEKKEETNGDGKDKQEKARQNGAANGDANGVDTVSERDSSEEELVIDEQDEMFPELTYDDTSDEEDAPSRSLTRRSQVKSTKTPETPRPASYKEDDSKEKVLKMNDSLATDRKLRSSDSPKRDPKKPESKKAHDSPKKDKTIDLTGDEEKSGDKESGAEKEKSTKNQLEMDVVIEVESIEEASESRGRTRARVSPYTRPKHDQTTSSMMANYTGNNTTMEMDISETSSILEDNLDDSGYLRGLRSIRGRASYKPLKEISLKHTLNRSARSVHSANTSLVDTSRPTGTVVGRKRKPDVDGVEVASEASGEMIPDMHGQNKRMRLFERIATPFRGFNTRAAEIVGINTDLPLTAPVASPPVFDPESLKPSSEPIAVPLPTPTQDADAKRCVIM